MSIRFNTYLGNERDEHKRKEELHTGIEKEETQSKKIKNKHEKLNILARGDDTKQKNKNIKTYRNEHTGQRRRHRAKKNKKNKHKEMNILARGGDTKQKIKKLNIKK